jgi:hypothetical protein
VTSEAPDGAPPDNDTKPESSAQELARQAGARLRRIDSAPLPWVFRRTAREVATAHEMTYSAALRLVIQGFEEAPR